MVLSLIHIYQVGGPSLTHFFDATVTLLKGKDGWFLIEDVYKRQRRRACGVPFLYLEG